MEVLLASLVGLGGIVGIFLIWLITAPWHAYALTIIWGWFIVPLGLPPLLLWQAMGVSMVCGYLTAHHSSCVEKENAWVGTLTWAIAKPAIALLFGWLILRIFT